MALRESLLPVSVLRLSRGLYDYLLRRDAGAPTPGLAPSALEQTTVDPLTLDRIAWGYSPGPSIDRRDPDGFVVWWQDAPTAQPTDGGILVAGDSRAFSMLWPTGAVRSYAVAAYRQTASGIETSPKLQHDTWQITAA